MMAVAVEKTKTALVTFLAPHSADSVRCPSVCTCEGNACNCDTLICLPLLGAISRGYLLSVVCYSAGSGEGGQNCPHPPREACLCPPAVTNSLPSALTWHLALQHCNTTGLLPWPAVRHVRLGCAGGTTRKESRHGWGLGGYKGGAKRGRGGAPRTQAAAGRGFVHY